MTYWLFVVKTPSLFMTLMNYCPGGQLVNSILLIILKYAELHFVRNGALLRDLFGVPGGDDDPPVFVA